MNPPEKKILNFAQAVSMNLGTLGILFAWELQIANVSGIYTFFGAKESDLGYLWLAPSIIGLITPLIIGYLSDRTVTSFGKRLPYIFWGAVAAMLCMFWLPNASSIAMAVILLCLFTVGVNAALQPFRPLVADIVIEQEHTKIYAIQAALIGIGATIASLLPWLLLFIFKQQPSSHQGVPFEIKLAFYIGAGILFLTCLWTTLTTRKYFSSDRAKPLHQEPSKKTLNSIAKDTWLLFAKIPKIMWQVSGIQFLTWLGAFCFIVYLTPVIEQSIFHMPIGAESSHNLFYKQILEKSVVLNGICCAIYMATNVIYAYIIPFLSKRLTRKTVHAISLLMGALSLVSLFFTHTVFSLLFAMIGIGIAWASFNSIPFAMVAGSLPEKELGIYMGIFNVAICLPQIIVSLGVGIVLKTFLHGNAVNLMVLAGLFIIIAALLTAFIKDKTIKEIA